MLTISLTSCGEWLNINVDPNNPSSSTVSVEKRLAFVQYHYNYAQQTAGLRGALVGQHITPTKGGSGNHEYTVDWNPIQAHATTPYQFWYVNAAPNIKEMIARAEETEAWHYMGAAIAIEAMGYMLMLDWYGETPYSEAVGSSITPAYDDGKTIFYTCMDRIDEAIEYFKKSQPASAPTLAIGDSWNNGDVNKWIKMCYGLKARWLNNLSKKSIYNPTDILAALENAPKSNADGTIVAHKDAAGDPRGVLNSDPVWASIIFNGLGMNAWGRITQWYLDLLEHPQGTDVTDPRTDKLVPALQMNIDGEIKWVRTKGVDLQSSIRQDGGPLNYTYNNTDAVVEVEDKDKNKVAVGNPKSIYVSSADPKRWGDSLYVNIRSSSKGYNSNVDDIYVLPNSDRGSSGTFYSRPDGPTHLVTYHEMCFIKAEVLFRQNRVADAYDAYVEGIKAHMELMNEKLNTYNNEHLGKTPIPQSEIDAFIASEAVGTSANLTMSKIMTQKYIACSFSQNNWNDMRRFDYDPTIYTGWDVPYTYKQNATAQQKIPLGQYFRRYMHCSHESNYNLEQLKASNPKARADDIWSVPVWWDTPDN